MGPMLPIPPALPILLSCTIFTWAVALREQYVYLAQPDTKLQVAMRVEAFSLVLYLFRADIGRIVEALVSLLRALGYTLDFLALVLPYHVPGLDALYRPARLPALPSLPLAPAPTSLPPPPPSPAAEKPTGPPSLPAFPAAGIPVSPQAPRAPAISFVVPALPLPAVERPTSPDFAAPLPAPEEMKIELLPLNDTEMA
ncbi:hypothetical protein LTR49_024930 [Elasticomyces elasticus]|nr:hypothetical protein LTR49_024930 [Elasticomyces elasticus]